MKFFINSDSSAHLRSLAKEMNESTNSVRLELNKMSEAGLLISHNEGKTIQYAANDKHPLFPELKSLVRKYLGLDKLVEQLVRRLGDVRYAFIVGDYAQGKDSGTIHLLIVGNVDTTMLTYLVAKTESVIHRRVKTEVMSYDYYIKTKASFNKSQTLLIWSDDSVM
ncbi:MAG TPA: hypothetical protein VFM99_11460 [Chitinophagales bacterium]|nr:hypothetical protein [Chitinophagales bacterium]